MAVLIGTLVSGAGAGVAVATALAVHAQRNWVVRRDLDQTAVRG
jgi:hypothetical protein